MAEQGDPGWDRPSPMNPADGTQQRAQKGPKGDFPDGPVVKNPPANAGDMGLIPALGRPHVLQGNSACASRRSPQAVEPMPCNERAHCNEKP